MFQVQHPIPVPLPPATAASPDATGILLCLCNALTETQVVAAIRQGARHPRDVHARCGHRPRPS